jgi:hypothetical protein
VDKVLVVVDVDVVVVVCSIRHAFPLTSAVIFPVAKLSHETKTVSTYTKLLNMVYS